MRTALTWLTAAITIWGQTRQLPFWDRQYACFGSSNLIVKKCVFIPARIYSNRRLTGQISIAPPTMSQDVAACRMGSNPLESNRARIALESNRTRIESHRCRNGNQRFIYNAWLSSSAQSRFVRYLCIFVVFGMYHHCVNDLHDK